MKLQKEFYLKNDVVQIAKSLLGKYLYTYFNGFLTGGIISETEAYAGISDKASHAFGNRRTKRTEVMFAEGGVAYVYLCYGMYPLFNVVTNLKDIPDAVLIRGVIPVEEIDIMLERISKKNIPKDFCQGPGRLTNALGITCSHSGVDLTGNKIWIEDKKLKVNKNNILITTRVGIDYAGDDAFRPYRFILDNIKKGK